MRRYASRQSVSFGGGNESVRRAQGILIIVLVSVLAAMLLVYFLAVRPNLTDRGTLQRQYRDGMKIELRSAISVANSESFTRTGGSSGHGSAASARSYLYAVKVLYDRYVNAGGPRMSQFDNIPSLLTEIDDQYIPSLEQGGMSTGPIVTEIQNRLSLMMTALDPEYNLP